MGSFSELNHLKAEQSYMSSYFSVIEFWLNRINRPNINKQNFYYEPFFWGMHCNRTKCVKGFWCFILTDLQIIPVKTAGFCLLFIFDRAVSCTATMCSWKLKSFLISMFYRSMFIKYTKTSMTDYFKAVEIKSLLENGQLTENLSSFRSNSRFIMVWEQSLDPGVVLENLRSRLAS